MIRLLDIGLEQLMAMVFRMGEISEKALKKSIKSFIDQKDSQEEISEISEVLMNMVLEVEDKAFELIVKYQPVASDLRIINSYMKIAYDFGRYCRYGLDVSLTYRIVKKLKKRTKTSNLVQQILDKVVKMVIISINALKQHNSELAKTLATMEIEVDMLYSAYLDELLQSSSIDKWDLCDLLVVRYLERIADHTTYVGESIVYIIEGKKISLR